MFLPRLRLVRRLLRPWPMLVVLLLHIGLSLNTNRRTPSPDWMLRRPGEALDLFSRRPLLEAL
jgi:hypothetical protein